jgi:hypothetical protein
MVLESSTFGDWIRRLPRQLSIPEPSVKLLMHQAAQNPPQHNDAPDDFSHPLPESRHLIALYIACIVPAMASLIFAGSVGFIADRLIATPMPGIFVGFEVIVANLNFAR